MQTSNRIHLLPKEVTQQLVALRLRCGHGPARSTRHHTIHRHRSAYPAAVCPPSLPSLELQLSRCRGSEIIPRAPLPAPKVHAGRRIWNSYALGLTRPHHLTRTDSVYKGCPSLVRWLLGGVRRCRPNVGRIPRRPFDTLPACSCFEQWTRISPALHCIGRIARSRDPRLINASSLTGSLRL